MTTPNLASGSRMIRKSADHKAPLDRHIVAYTIKLRRLKGEAHMDTTIDKVASECVARKLGAQREGILRKRILLRGAPHDALMMSLLPQDLSQEPLHLQANAPLPLYPDAPLAASA